MTTTLAIAAAGFVLGVVLGSRLRHRLGMAPRRVYACERPPTPEVPAVLRRAAEQAVPVHVSAMDGRPGAPGRMRQVGDGGVALLVHPEAFEPLRTPAPDPALVCFDLDGRLHAFVAPLRAIRDGSDGPQLQLGLPIGIAIGTGPGVLRIATAPERPLEVVLLVGERDYYGVASDVSPDGLGVRFPAESRPRMHPGQRVEALTTVGGKDLTATVYVVRAEGHTYRLSPHPPRIQRDPNLRCELVEEVLAMERDDAA